MLTRRRRTLRRARLPFAFTFVGCFALLAACGEPGTSVDLSGPAASPVSSVVIGAEPLAPPTTAATPTTSATVVITPPSTAATVTSTAAPAAPASTSPTGRTGSVYAGPASGRLSPATAGARTLVYVPHESGYTSVIDPATFAVVDQFPTGAETQHVIPSHDLRTLYAASNAANSITPIDPTTGKPGRAFAVDDPYNLYFLPDGSEAIVVAEGRQRLDFVDPHTFAVHQQIPTACPGINHIDFAADGSFLVATCEFGGSLIKFDLRTRSVAQRLTIDMSPSGRRGGVNGAQPQDVRIAPDGKVFYVASLASAGVYVIDAATFTQRGFIPTGVGAHALYPSRDGTKLYVVNRGTTQYGSAPAHGPGSITVVDFANGRVVGEWPMPNGGSPDMGNLNLDGTQLWLGGRYDSEVYVFDTTAGQLVKTIKTGLKPHGLTVWPQPGSFSLGHTGNMR